MLATIGAIAGQKKPLVVTPGNYYVEAITTFGRLFGNINVTVSGNIVTAEFTSGYVYAENAGDTQESINATVQFSQGGTSSLSWIGLTPGGYSISLIGNSIQCNLNNVTEEQLRINTGVTAYTDGQFFQHASDSELIGQVPV